MIDIPGCSERTNFKCSVSSIYIWSESPKSEAKDGATVMDVGFSPFYCFCLRGLQGMCRDFVF